MMNSVGPGAMSVKKESGGKEREGRGGGENYICISSPIVHKGDFKLHS